MNLKSVVNFSQEKFNEAGYNEIQRGDILMHFFRDEMGLTPEKFEELITTGITEVSGPDLEGTDRARFFLWYYINYVADHLAEDCEL